MTTTEQLITELGKPRKGYPQGVLTWEEGDEAVHKKYDYKFIVIDVEIRDEHDRDKSDKLIGRSISGKVSTCTHSADDPRLLGRALKALDAENMFHFLDLVGIAVGGREAGDKTVKNGILIHAALQALLAKVEGEQA